MSTESVRKVERDYGYGSREAIMAREKEASQKANQDVDSTSETEFVETQFPEPREYYVEIDHPATPSYTVATVHNYWSQGGYTDVNGNYVGAKFYKILYKFVYGPFRSMSDAELNIAKLNRRNRDAGLPEDSWATQINGEWYVQFFATTKLSEIDDRMDKLEGKSTPEVKTEFDPAKDRIAALEKALKDAEARAAALAEELKKAKEQKPQVVQAPAQIQYVDRVIYMTNNTVKTQVVQTERIVQIDKTAELRAKDILEKAKVAYGVLPGDSYSTLNSVAATGLSGASASIRNDLATAQSQYDSQNFADAENTAASVYNRAKEEAMNIYLAAYRGLYTTYHGQIAAVDTEQGEAALSQLDAIEAEVKNPAGKLGYTERAYDKTLANAESALKRDITRDEVYSKKLLEEIDAKRAEINNKLRTVHAIDPFMKYSNDAMAALGMDYSEYVAKRGTLTNQSTDVITTRSTANDAKVKQYLGICETLVGKIFAEGGTEGLNKKQNDNNVNKSDVEKYFKAINKVLGGRGVDFNTAYELEQKYRIIGAASLAILMAYSREPGLQNITSLGNIYISQFNLNEILKSLGQ